MVIGILGNPNSGKTTFFNRLTRLRYSTANFPGATVEKAFATIRFNGKEATLIDFPGLYSIYSTSEEENQVSRILMDRDHPDHPDLVIYMASLQKLEQHLLLFTQLADLNIPTFFVLNMSDKFTTDPNYIDQLSEKIGVPIHTLNARSTQGSRKLILTLEENYQQEFQTKKRFFKIPPHRKELHNKICSVFPGEKNDYIPWIKSSQSGIPLPPEKARLVEKILEEEQASPLNLQVEDTMARFDSIGGIPVAFRKNTRESEWSSRIDTILTHRIYGPLIFFLVMFIVFQAIFSLATLPMELIEWFFDNVIINFKEATPAAWWSGLISDGILPGLSGILIFIPQIAILFFLIHLLEQTGYMSRAVFLFDRIMHRFGLNGRSMVALISGHACAIPAVMSTRTISNYKERLLTIFVTPLTSCSARIPVYTLLIALVIPSREVWGIFNLQGIVFFSLYLLGIAGALIVALVLKHFLSGRSDSFLMIELPSYQWPDLRTVIYEAYDNVKAFVVGAGKIILMISIVLWFLASYGPAEDINRAQNRVIEIGEEMEWTEDEIQDKMAAATLEESYAGHMGRWLEPVIRPLGYDWKIGVALVTSFAAREVIVGTLATIYSVGDDEEVNIQAQLRKAKWPDDSPVFTLPAACSLLVFYVFALQCMSTLAVVKKETGTWFWPALQFVLFLLIAYSSAWITYNLLS